MYKLLNKYSKENKEKFNDEFITSRNDQDVLQYFKDIFASLEILDEVKVEEIQLETDESQFGPIKTQHRYFKSILQSRLNRVYYRVRITPSENTENIPILDGEKKEVKSNDTPNENSFVKEGYVYINKLIDKAFYINEGVRYYLIYQIVDNATYGTGECVSLKSLAMPITIERRKTTVCPEFFGTPKEVPSFDVRLFAKKVSPLLYFIGKEAYNFLVKMPISDNDKLIEEWMNAKDPEIVDKLNSFLGTDLEFSSYIEKLQGDDRVIFNMRGPKDKEEGICYFSVSKEKFENDYLTQGVVGSLMDMRNPTKKKRIIFTYDQLISPWFWINELAAFFTKNSDAYKKFEKIKTMLISLARLVDTATRNILPLAEKDKENTLTIIRYIMREFEDLCAADSQDLANKRIRLFEYQTYPLRKYFSSQIYRVLNSSTRSRNVLERIFSNLNPMFIIKQTITNELLRYYNATNEMNLYTCLMRYTFRGPQSVNKTVSMEQRDLHPSYTGRLSLIASSASDPGMSGTITPFIETYDYYFEKQDN